MARIIASGNGCGMDTLSFLHNVEDGYYSYYQHCRSPNTPEGYLLEILKAMENPKSGYGESHQKGWDKNAKPIRVPIHLLYAGTCKQGGYYRGGEAIEYACDVLKMGTYIKSKPTKNRMYHPNRDAIIWVWTPDPIAVIRWWVKKRPDSHKVWCDGRKEYRAKKLAERLKREAAVKPKMHQPVQNVRMTHVQVQEW